MRAGGAQTTAAPLIRYEPLIKNHITATTIKFTFTLELDVGDAVTVTLGTFQHDSNDPPLAAAHLTYVPPDVLPWVGFQSGTTTGWTENDKKLRLEIGVQQPAETNLEVVLGTGFQMRLPAAELLSAGGGYTNANLQIAAELYCGDTPTFAVVQSPGVSSALGTLCSTSIEYSQGNANGVLAANVGTELLIKFTFSATFASGDYVDIILDSFSGTPIANMPLEFTVPHDNIQLASWTLADRTLKLQFDANGQAADTELEITVMDSAQIKLPVTSAPLLENDPGLKIAAFATSAQRVTPAVAILQSPAVGLQSTSLSYNPVDPGRAAQITVGWKYPSLQQLNDIVQVTLVGAGSRGP